MVIELRESCTEIVSTARDAHTLLGESVPAWITSFDVHCRNRLISGGDDMTLKLWDVRDMTGHVAVNRKTHTAGVTSVRWTDQM